MMKKTVDQDQIVDKELEQQNTVLETLYQADEVEVRKQKLRALKDRMLALKARLAQGSKSDLDAIGVRLDELSSCVDEILA